MSERTVRLRHAAYLRREQKTSARRLGRVTAGATAALVTLALAGCSIGLPDGVVRDGVGPSAAPWQADSTPADPPRWSPRQDNPVELVLQFLEAAAGDHAVDGSRATLMTQVEQFVAEDKRPEWDPGPDLALVRMEGTPSRRDDKGVSTVDVTLRYVGSLTPEGRVTEHEGTTRKFSFQFDRGPDQELFIKNPPDELLLNVDKLETYYRRLPIYFWNSDGTSLVPDLRYLPRAVAPEQVNNRLVDWLLQGPSTWLKQAVADLPGDTSRVDNIVKDGNLVKANLAVTAPEVNLRALGQQLYWTLAEQRDEELNLQVNRSTITIRFDDAKAALISSAVNSSDPQQYAVRDEKLIRLGAAGGELLDPTGNNNVLAASVARGEDAFALVREVSGRPRLFIQRENGLMHPVDIPDVPRPKTMSAPIWLDRSSSVALVVVDGRLYTVTAERDVATPVNSQRIPGAITALTVAPDGRRLGLVLKGRLYVAGLQRKGILPGSFTVLSLRPVPTSLDGELQGVAFISDTELVAGAGGDQVRLTEVSVDGAVEQVFVSERGGEVSNLTAYVPDGGRTEFSNEIMLDVGHHAYQAFNSGGRTLLQPLESLVRPSSTASPSPSSSASPSAGTPQEADIWAPCFEG